MLHESLRDPERVASLAAAWTQSGNLRIAPFFDEDIARDILAAMQAEGMDLKTGDGALRFQYFQTLWQPGTECEHLLCHMGRWLWSDGVDFASKVTGIPLGPPAERAIHCTLYTRGCYLDPHNDYDGARQVAFVIGMTTDAMPHELGGHLEFLDAHDGKVVVRERRKPGWNTLDLFDVRKPLHIHRIPMVTEPMDRRAITGWLYEPGAQRAK